MKEDFLRLIGPIPDDGGNRFKRRRRVHQGWWRTSVLLEEAGANPGSPANRVCNMFNLTNTNRDQNYVSEAAVRAVEHELTLRQTDSGFGIIQNPESGIICFQPATLFQLLPPSI
jgi:hypothetical protein